MRRRWQALSLIIAPALLAACAWASTPRLAHAQSDPDFTNVSDILQGRRILLPVDDLVVSSQPGASTSGVGNIILQTTDSQIASQIPYPITGSPVPAFATGVGRMFNRPRDIIFTVTEAGANVRDQGVTDQGFPISQSHPVGLVMADLNGDGYDDVALLTATAPGSTGGLLRIVSANNVDDINDGLFVSDGVGPESVNFSEPIAMATGDFNGDGKREVAIAQAFPAGGTKLLFQVYEVLTTQDGKIAPRALQRTLAQVLDSPGPLFNVALVAGNFDGAVGLGTGSTTDELVLVLHFGTTLYLQGFGLNSQLNGISRSGSVFISPDNLPSAGDLLQQPLLATSGRLDWFSPAEQVVLGYTQIVDPSGPSWNFPLVVFTLDNQLTITQGGAIFSPTGVAYGLAVGNFDQDLGPTNPPNLEIATVVPATGSGVWDVLIATVDPANGFALSPASLTPLSLLTLSSPPLALAAGDTQGRSLVLGPPNKVTITQYHQPEIILGAPPLHVDWVTPQTGSTPVALNLSAVPDSFYSQYQTAVTQQDQSSRKSTTSFSYATKETTETKVSFGVPLVASISATITTAAQQTHDNVVSTAYNTYSSRGFDASTQTGFGDHVWLTGKRWNIYYYPVIGHCIPCADAEACAEAADSCPAGTRPLVIQFSGPDMVIQEDVNGTNLEWYQPVHEVGNILSYPRDQTQLEALIARFNLLSPAPPTTFFTDGSATTERANWAQGGGSQVTQGSTRTFSFSTSVSVSASATAVGDFFTAGASGSESFSVNTSQSIATLNSSAESMGASTGLGITTARTVLDPATYQYAWQPLISGQLDPPGTLQKITTETDHQFTGILRAAFTADPTDPSAGSWWGPTYVLPDVALNHPARWVPSTETSAPDQPPPSNCLRVTPGSTAMDCMTFRAPDPADVTGSGFYWIKGLFVTPADAGGAGPQVVQATAGDVLQLQVRVYNYSLADMPPGSVVRVQFYGQLYNNSTGELEPGTSFLIGDETRGAIPGFPSIRSGSETPNWIVAGTSFDTTSHSDQYLIFWVVVWGEDGTALMTEMPDHGLTAIPPGTLPSITDVPIESHSNNVGFYRQPIYVQPPPSAEVATGGPGRVIVPSVSVSPAQVPPHGLVKVRAVLQSVDGSADGVSVFFYDGDPAGGGRAFDHELVPHIRTGDTYLTQVPFQPRTCGDHMVVVVADPARIDAGVGSATVRVALEPVAALGDFATFVAGFGLPRGTEKSLLAKVRAAQASFDRGNAKAGRHQLGAFQHGLSAQRGKHVPDAAADALLAELARLLGCF